MITRDALCLTIDKFPDEVEIFFFYLDLLHPDVSVTHGKKYLPKGSKENTPSITIAGNVSVGR